VRRVAGSRGTGYLLHQSESTGPDRASRCWGMDKVGSCPCCPAPPSWQLSSLMLGENKPFAMEPTITTYRNVGAQVKVTPQVTADGSVTLDLNVSDSRGRDSEFAPGRPEFILTTLTGKIGVASGQVALAKDAKVISKEGEGETLILVGARVVKPDAETRKYSDCRVGPDRRDRPKRSGRSKDNDVWSKRRTDRGDVRSAMC
jgi:hypothetical protein